MQRCIGAFNPMSRAAFQQTRKISRGGKRPPEQVAMPVRLNRQPPLRSSPPARHRCLRRGAYRDRSWLLADLLAQQPMRRFPRRVRHGNDRGSAGRSYAEPPPQPGGITISKTGVPSCARRIGPRRSLQSSAAPIPPPAMHRIVRDARRRQPVAVPGDARLHGLPLRSPAHHPLPPVPGPVQSSAVPPYSP